MFYTTSQLKEYIEGEYLKVRRKAEEDGVYRPLNVHFGDKALPLYDCLYCYSDDEGYHYCYEERGVVSMHKKTTDLSEITYMVISSRIKSMSYDYECKNRVKGQDNRRIAFKKWVEYLSLIDPVYAQKAQEEIDEILEEVPFEDDDDDD